MRAAAGSWEAEKKEVGHMLQVSPGKEQGALGETGWRKAEAATVGIKCDSMWEAPDQIVRQ